MSEAKRRMLNLGILAAGLLLVWEVLYLAAGDEALKSPLDTIRYTARLIQTDLFRDNLTETMRAFGLALVSAVGVGLLLGFWLGYHVPSGALFTPMLVAFASVPKIVLYPIILLAFGLGLSAKVVFGAMHGVPPIALSTLGAVTTVRPVLLKLGRVLRLDAFGTLRIIVIPAALPEVMTGLRLGFALTLIGTVLGEMFASQLGLGYLLMTAIGLHDLDMIMSVALILSILALSSSLVLLAIDRRLRRRF